MSDAPLNSVPDWSHWGEAEAWIKEGLEALDGVSAPASVEFAEVDTPSDPVSPSALGRFSDGSWRRAVLATFFADLASYRAPVDQVTFDRLCFVMHAFPRGFRTYWTPVNGYRWWPIGYSGWYPMQPSTFRRFQPTVDIENRMVVPAALIERPYVYVFNYSVAAPFKGTALSRALVKRLAAAIDTTRPRGLASIAVSADGCRIAERFGMRRTGSFNLGGAEDQVLATPMHHSSAEENG